MEIYPFTLYTVNRFFEFLEPSERDAQEVLKFKATDVFQI